VGELVSPVSLVADGEVRDLVFRRHKRLWRPDYHVYNLFVGDEYFGFVTPSHAWKGRWDAWSDSQTVQKSLRNCPGFATRMDAGTFIVKTHGYWENT
jgi:hypothetical protein